MRREWRLAPLATVNTIADRCLTASSTLRCVVAAAAVAVDAVVDAAVDAAVVAAAWAIYSFSSELADESVAISDDCARLPRRSLGSSAAVAELVVAAAIAVLPMENYRTLAADRSSAN